MCPTATPSHRSRHKCVRHLCQNSVYEIKIGTLNAPLILHQQIMVMSDSQGELLTTITQILVRMVILDVLFDLILYVPLTIFQLNRDGSSWVEPVLSLNKRVLLKDHNAVTPVRLEPAAPRSQFKHSSTEPLRSHVI